MRRSLRFLLPLMILPGLACGWDNPSNGLAVDPPEPVVAVGERLTLQALATEPLPEQPTWEVADFRRGAFLNSRGSRVTYLAPQGAGTYQVVVCSRHADGSPMRRVVSVRVLPTVHVSPAFVNLFPGGTCAFTARIKGLAHARVAWVVEEPDGGSIAEDGIYTAPKQPGFYHVIATCTTHPDAAANAVVKVE